MRGVSRPLEVELNSSTDDAAGVVVPIPTWAMDVADVSKNKDIQ
jgi:hypothetical protein